jgi:2-keto-4-pentenoate hydratase/2-oxohepta-3-ene-1,7-dioic acid hydratase in catechol pathway
MSTNHYSLVRIQSERGERAGLLVGQSIYDVADATGNAAWVSIKAILAAGPKADAQLRQLAEKPRGAGIELAGAQLLAPVDEPSGIFCIGANYRDHAASMAKAHGVPLEPDARTLGLTPWFFIKTAHALVGPGAEVVLASERFDWEAELGAVIGRAARRVPVSDALNYVGAYTVANDLSARDRGMRPKIRDTSPFKWDWVAHKNFEGGCALGPTLVPATQVSDPQSLGIKLWVNEELKQDSNTSQMIFSLAEQIAFLSTLITLRPGDIILTGTPAGTGAESKVFLKRDDKITVQIEQLGAPLVTYIR